MTTEQTQQPSPEEVQKATQVAQAGAEAQATGGDPRQAMRTKADEVKLEISDQDIDRIAAALSSNLVAAFEQRGAFDQPPEPVQPPDQPTAPPPPGEQPPPAEEAPAPPVKRTFAHRFMGS